MILWFLCPGTPEGSTGSGSGLKASQKTGQRLKVSSDRLGEEEKAFCGFSMGRNQYWAGRVYDLCVYYMTGTPKAQPKVVFYGEAGNRTCDPW